MPFVSYLLFLITALCSTQAFSQEAQVATTGSTIVAVVNDQVVTQYDLAARIRFVAATSHLSDSPESINRLRPQIIRALVDERLQLQEAKRRDINVTDKELEQAIASIEAQRGMSPGEIAHMLSTRHVPEETFHQQLRAQIAWGKLLQRAVRPRITEEDIAQMTRKLSAPVIQQELRIALLQLPVDQPKRDQEVRQAAEKLVLEVRKGANFEELARQFAGGTAKLSSFWVRPEELDPYLTKALQSAEAGTITDPLKNELGYALIKVYETRDIDGQKAKGTEVTLKEITLRLRSSADENAMESLKALAEKLSEHPGSCTSKDVGESGDTSIASIAVTNQVSRQEDLPSTLRVVIEGMKEGEISAPLITEEGITLYMLCGRREGVAAVVDAQRAKAAVYQQRMELEAQKYMRNLRRDGFIEIRGL